MCVCVKLCHETQFLVECLFKKCFYLSQFSADNYFKKPFRKNTG